MTKVLVGLFWGMAGIIAYTFVGYPLLATLIARLKRLPVKKQVIIPEVTIVIAAYNEAAVIASKIENCLALDYPNEKLFIVVVADGSDDETCSIAAQYSAVDLHFAPERQGKGPAVNRVMPTISSEIVLVTDANAMLAPGSLRAIVANFADPTIGGVAGEKRVLGGGEGLYWRYESYLKKQDSEFGSVMGAAGELFAIRTQAFVPTEDDAILEDFILSMRMVAAGWRFVYEPKAIAWEAPSPGLADDWERRTRTAAGGYQAIYRLPEMLNPRRGWLFWQYVSHRVLRWAVTPFLLPAIFLLNLLLSRRTPYQFLMLGQLFLYGAGLLGYIKARRGMDRGIPGAIFYFFLANLAALAGFRRIISGRQPVTWQKIRRSTGPIDTPWLD